ncbi:MAG: DUF1588 domain-containing protein [Bdellovibrionales bacterium]|nr:DUF1588 domain-containing protein [Bdellovibrionales bacterium]
MRLVAVFFSICVLCAGPAAASASPIVETNYNGKPLFCTINNKGKVQAGKLKSGKFKKFPRLQSFKRALKVARKLRDSAALKRARKKFKKAKAQIKACQVELAQQDESPTPSPTPTPISGVPFEDFHRVITTHCASCHLNQHTQWLELDSKEAWLAARSSADVPLIDQDDLEHSYILQRIRYFGGPNSTMPLSNLNATAQFTAADYNIIRSWIIGLNGGGGDSIPPPVDEELEGNELSSAALFACTGSPEPSKPRLRRIDNLEWAATLGKRGSDARYNPLVADGNHQYSTFSEGETLNDTVLSEYFNYLWHTREGWIDGSTSSGVPRPPEHRCMIQVTTPSTDCIRSFLRVYLKNFVLFREPSEGELTRLATFAADAVANNPRDTQAQRSAVMEQITSAAWSTTAALFRSELGKGERAEEGANFLSDTELGKSLAYTLTDQGPGAPSKMQPARVFPPLPRIQAIEDAVDDGSIGSSAVLDSLIDLNYSGIDQSIDSHYSEYWLTEKLERFFIEWLGFDELTNSFHDTPESTSSFEGIDWVTESFNHMKKPAYYGHEITLAEQALAMIARIIQNDSEVVRTLFTSRDFYLPSNLESSFGSTQWPQAVYNVSSDIAATREARWNVLPESERAGILTHPAWLAAHADNFENGPSAVKRGKWVRENALCGMVPDVPITVDASFPPETAHLSARERLIARTSDSYCQTCHSLMNPLGLPFEIYNHAGFLRAQDHGAQPNGESDIIFTGDATLDGHVADAVEFSEKLAASPLVEQCFIRQIFRFFIGRLETHNDACTLTAMENTYQQTNGSLKETVKTLLKSPTFTMRYAVEEEQ